MSTVLEIARTASNLRDEVAATITATRSERLLELVQKDQSGEKLSADERTEVATYDVVEVQRVVDSVAEIKAAQAQVADCLAARIRARTGSLAIQAEDARRLEDDKFRLAFDQTVRQRYMSDGALSSRHGEALARLKRALPPGESAKLDDSKLAIRAINTAINEHCRLLEIAQKTMPELPVHPGTHHDAVSNAQRLDEYAQDLRKYEREKRNLEQVTARLAQLRADLETATADHVAMERELLGG